MTVTVPDFFGSYYVWVIQAGTGRVTFVGSNGISIRNLSGHNTTAGQYSVVELIAFDGREYVLSGDTADAPPPIVNHALSGTATASNEFSSSYAATNAINGDRRGIGYPTNAIWAAGSVSEWMEVAFAGSKSIQRIDVITMADVMPMASEPTLDDTFTTNGITAFEVQY